MDIYQMTPNLQYHCNIHFAVRGLVDGDLSYVSDCTTVNNVLIGYYFQ
jgi:hypothetical protein